jgi:hypothetical protein
VNRHDRRARDAKARSKGHRVQVFEMPAGQLKEMLADPAYRAEVELVAQYALVWRAEYPEAALEWIEQKGAWVSGSLGDPHVRGYLAKNQAADELLAWVDEQTGKRLTVGMAAIALVGLGWIGQGSGS